MKHGFEKPWWAYVAGELNSQILRKARWKWFQEPESCVLFSLKEWGARGSTGECTARGMLGTVLL